MPPRSATHDADGRTSRDLDPRRAIAVLVVDDHPAVRAGVSRLIEDHRDMVVVGEAASADEAFRKLVRMPDVVVLDYQLGSARTGLWLTQRVAASRRPPSVLIYSAFADEALAVAAIVAGADGLLSKGALGEELCDEVRRLARGGRALPSITRGVSLAMESRLEARDRPILGMLLNGDHPRTIAERLSLSDRELGARRARMLLALAPTTAQPGVLPGTRAPLDYEPLRARLNVREPPPTGGVTLRSST
jgi:DNA-binding NarL/FixJ family response regulator